VLTRIGPLAPHQFPMPFEHSFGLENPYEIAELWSIGACAVVCEPKQPESVYLGERV
jgi:hypothetical protein